MAVPLLPGPIVLFGSGETSPSGRKIFERIFLRLPPAPRVALLETPAGFEPNSPQVAGRVAAFIEQRLQNYQPQCEVIPARGRGTLFSPDDPAIAARLVGTALIFMGPGSPTYAVRQLRASLTWAHLRAAHRAGAGLALASAAAIAIGRWALPVYEIYKVGEGLRWKPGLDLLAPYGLSLIFVPHWNNNDGGEELDTSRCYLGRERFEKLLALLPGDQTVVGIDEYTGLLLDLAAERCEVVGVGGVTVLRHGRERYFQHSFSLGELGRARLPAPGEGLPPEVWEAARRAARALVKEALEPPAEVRALAEQREAARARGDWAAADQLREQIRALGWQVQDTPAGPRLRWYQE